MDDDLSFAPVAALIGEPARARILAALMGGLSLTASELADEAGVTLPTASAHLAKLREAGLIAVERQGRHHYHRLSGGEVARMLESLMGVAHRDRAPRRRPGPRQPDLRRARVCYDHLAGEVAVAVFDRLCERRVIEASGGGLVLTEAGARFFTGFGVDVGALERSRRPLCRPCLDWSERRMHLAGGLGAALLARLQVLGWAVRQPDSRVVTFSADGERALLERFGVTVPR